ncbi:hypothetical protein MRX96_047179 [Rhipicephalus microplus]
MTQTRMESNHVTTEVVVPNGLLVNNEDVATNAARRHKTDEHISESTETCFDEDEDLPEAEPFHYLACHLPIEHEQRCSGAGSVSAGVSPLKRMNFETRQRRCWDREAEWGV